MSNDSSQYDAEIIFAAYAERVKEAFKIFADNLGVGENEKLCRDRFARSLNMVRRARDLALHAASGEAEAATPEEQKFAAKDEADAAGDAAAKGEEIPAGPLSAEHQAMVDKALAGTRGSTMASRYQRR